MMENSYKRKGAPMMPDPDIEVASINSYGRAMGDRPQPRGKPIGTVRIPEPDSEVESVDDFKSAIKIGRHSQLKQNK